MTPAPVAPGNERGAVLLLSVYFAALTFLLLTAVSLQRSTVELRASQLSRDQTQAFYLAEAGIDRAPARLAHHPRRP